VPQVHPVGPDADPAQRGQAGDDGDDAVAGGRGDQAGGRQRGQDQPDRVDRRVVAREVPDGPGQHREAGDAGRVEALGLRR